MYFTPILISNSCPIFLLTRLRLLKPILDGIRLFQ